MNAYSIEPEYFKLFDTERICIDKVFFIVYDGQYAREKHPFDTDLRDRYFHNVKRSRISKGRPEEVIRSEDEYSSWELQLRGSRTMRFHVNLIRYLQKKHDLKPENVIYDDNFLPPDYKQLTHLDFVKAFRDFQENAQLFYKQKVKQFWGVDLDEVQIKISEVEVPFEIYPASVEDITNELYAKGVAFSKYNTQSGTVYLNDVKCDNEIATNRKYEKTQKIDTSNFTPDITYLNKINSGKNESKIQIKIYQKTFGLCRIEFTMFNYDARRIFDFRHRTNDGEIADDLVLFCHYCLRSNGIVASRYDRSLDDIVQFLAVSLKESEDLIYNLRGCDVFEVCRANRNVAKRLTRKGILIKKFDSNGTQQRGVYLVNTALRRMLRTYEPSGNEHFKTDVNEFFPDV